MESFLQWITDAMNSGDKELRTWFLIRNNYLPFILCGFYALFSVYIGPAIMKNRKPFDLRKVMIYYNFAVVATYILCLVGAAWCATKITKEMICEKAVVIKGDISYTIATFIWVGYLLKYIEFLDTVFFILRKKEKMVTFLHVFHHTVVPLIVFVALRTETNGIQCLAGTVNAVVHTIMYTYYGLAALGPQARKYLWWKKYLTQLQMAQFIIIVFLGTVLRTYSICSVSTSGYAMNIVFCMLFFFLFLNYYKKTHAPETERVCRGTMRKEDEQINGKSDLQSGKTVDQNGKTVYQNGKTVYQNGKTVYQNGKTNSQNENAYFLNEETDNQKKIL